MAYIVRREAESKDPVDPTRRVIHSSTMSERVKSSFVGVSTVYGVEATNELGIRIFKQGHGDSQPAGPVPPNGRPSTIAKYLV